MTVAASPPRNDYVGNGAVATYSYSFRIFAATDLRVTKRTTANVETTLSYPTDYTVTGVGAAAGGTITLTAGVLPADYALTLRFDRTPIQSTDLRNQGSFLPETHEDKFDELTRYAQQLKDVLDRALHLAETEVGTPAKTTLPVQATRASKFLAFDASGNPIAAAGTSADLTPVSAFINTLLDDATAALARATLGAIGDAIIDAKGDLIVGSAADTPVRKAVGADGTALVALDAATGGLHYQSGALNGAALLGGKLTVTMAANAVTIAIKTDAGNDPSTTEPVWARFRSSTATDGVSVLRKITAPTSTVISSGSTLGTASAVPSRIHIGLLDNAGTVELCYWNVFDAASGLVTYAESQRITTTAEGGAGGADTIHVAYATAARSNVAWAYAGYFESTQATAGTWATAASVVHTAHAGTPRPGDVVQWRFSQSSAMATGTTVIPADDTIPQITEGDQYMSFGVQPTNECNALIVSAQAQLSGANASDYRTMALFRDATANALAAVTFLANATQPQPLQIQHMTRALATAVTTFRIRAGTGSASTLTFNGVGGAALMGGVFNSYMKIEEVWT